MNWQSFLFVFLGSGLGGFFRYLISFSHSRIDENGLKHYIPILTVNIVGSLLIGIAYGFLEKNGLSDKLNVLLITGFLGGFTTYSSFSLDILKIVQRGEIVTASIYLLSTLLFGLIAVYLGYLLMK